MFENILYVTWVFADEAEGAAAGAGAINDLVPEFEAEERVERLGVSEDDGIETGSAWGWAWVFLGFLNF